jgi:TonB family protein
MMMYVFMLLFVVPSMIGYAGCTSDHNPQQKAVVDQRQTTAAVQNSSQEKKAPEMPKPIVTKAPVYPEEARKKGISGEVQVQILVTKDGLVKDATVISNKTGSKDLEKAALDAVNQWKFEPGKLDGKPVEVNVIIPIKFKLDDKKK